MCRNFVFPEPFSFHVETNLFIIMWTHFPHLFIQIVFCYVLMSTPLMSRVWKQSSKVHQSIRKIQSPREFRWELFSLMNFMGKCFSASRPDSNTKWTNSIHFSVRCSRQQNKQTQQSWIHASYFHLIIHLIFHFPISSFFVSCLILDLNSPQMCSEAASERQRAGEA